MSQARALADVIVRTVTGPMWHGPPLNEVLKNVTHQQAVRRPIASAHTIWELVGHVITWVEVARDRIGGSPRTRVLDEEDWPSTPSASAAAWHQTLDRLEERHRELAAAVAALSDDQLAEHVVGHNYTLSTLLHGVVEHGTYHGGQIALLKKLIAQQS